MTPLNQIKKPAKKKSKVDAAESSVKALFAMAITANIKKPRPPKQPVIMRVRPNVMGACGAGLRNEKGHQMKSLSESHP